MKALLDTNILIDFLRGVPEAKAELARYDRPAISVITWMEVMVGAPAAAERGTQDFLAGFDMVNVDAAVSARAVRLRLEHRMKLPDAIVWASAQVREMLMVTRDAKDFPPDDPGVRIPYRVPGSVIP